MEGIAKKKHSEFGIASVCIAILGILIYLSFFTDTTSNWLSYFQERWFVLPFLAILLGVGGLLQKGRKKILPILGIVLPILEFGSFIFIIVIMWD